MKTEHFATMISNQISIKRIYINWQTFKLNLFADNLTPFKSDPLITIAEVEKIIGDFGQLSSLSFNPFKMTLYPIHLHQESQTCLKFSYAFHCDSTHCEHLDIKIPLHLVHFLKK